MDKIEVKEREIERKVDIIATRFARRAGYSSVPWFQLTWYLLWIYTVLTCFVMFSRPDFLNLTVCTTALYMMFNTDRITKTRFKILVLGIFISIIYDVFWFIMMHYEYSAD
jgi:hypothetical protein